MFKFKTNILISIFIFFGLSVSFPPVVLTQDIQRTPIVFTVVNATKGDFNKDKPNIPSFYIWRSIFSKRDKCIFKPYLVNSNGLISLVEKIGLNFNEWKDFQNTKLFKVDKSKKDLNFQDGEVSLKLTSRDGKWLIEKAQESDDGDEATLELVNNITKENLMVALPAYEEGLSFYHFVDWNPKKDLFYFWVSGGADTGRHCDFYQLDPETRVLISLGMGNGLNKFSPDGNWIIWGDGYLKDCVYRQVGAFNIQENKNYLLTSGSSDNLFIEWADVWNTIQNHVRAGKDFYHNKNFESSVYEYQKAINLDPYNYDALGLMGYACLRNQQTDKAIIYLEKSIEVNKRYTMGYYNLALAYWADGQKTKALEQVKDVLVFDKKYKILIKQDPQFKSFESFKEFDEMLK